uniref:Ubiquitin-like protease family profile domain-containing protein n=1 Tax=Oryza punctata TaxID=4537 RepID=A0A0E0LVS3_ORYPU
MFLKVKKQKSRANTESSFTRFSARYFSEVISSLSEYQKSIVHKYDFDYLLLFESNFVPIKFATWIVKNVDVRTSEIILKNKIIPVTVESVHAVLGLPFGGIEFNKDYEADKQCIVSMFGQVSIPSVKFFGDQLIQKKVLYLDYVDFGSIHVDQGYPCISVWKDDMISPGPAHSRSISIRAKIDSTIGSMIPDFLKDKISQMLSTHLCSHHLVDSESCEDVLVSILALLAQSSQFEPLEHKNEAHICPSQINTEAGPTKRVLTPDVGYLTNRNNDVYQSKAGSSVAALILVKDVANKFRRAIFSEDVPSFRLLCSEDYSSDSDQCHELAGNVTPSCYEQLISFHFVPNTPHDMIRGNQDVGSNERRNCQNANKRIFQDLTTDELYNSSKIYLQVPKNLVRLVESFDAVDIDNVKAKVYNFGHSLKKGGYVSSYVMSVFCRVMSHNNHPSRSKKNYFFPSIGVTHVSNCDMEKVKKSFLGAATARKLHLCDMLYFPIYINQHWFLFIVNMKNRMIIDNFQSAWDKFVRTPIDFLSFKIVFPPVPRQVLRTNFLVLVKLLSFEKFTKLLLV